MARSSRKQIEEDERKVIAELQKNARESVDQMSKKFDFSRQKVWRIINRLEKDHTIWGYPTLVDNEKLGLRSYLVLIKKTIKSVEELADIIISRDLEKRAEELNVRIESSHYLHGQYDWAICFTAEDIEQAKKFTEALITTYQTYIGDLILMEKIFPVKRCGLQNPHLEKLKEFCQLEQ